jgi:hypothetical protein
VTRCPASSACAVSRRPVGPLAPKTVMRMLGELPAAVIP